MNEKKERIPYTYLIGWSNLDKWYYGSRTRKGCRPDDLWTTYFTSSKVVQRFREKHGEPDIIEIRRIFDEKKSAVLWEQKILKRMNVIENLKWLNAAINSSALMPPKTKNRIKYSKAAKLRHSDPSYKKKHSDSIKKSWIERRKQPQISRPHSEETKEKLRRPKTEAHKEKLSILAKERGAGAPIEFMKKLSESNIGKKRSIETKQKQSIARTLYWKKKRCSQFTSTTDSHENT